MKVIALALLLLSCVSALFAQPQSTTRDHSPTTVRWQEGAEGADRFFSDGVPIKVLTANGVAVSVSLQDTGWKMRADVVVANRSQGRVDVLPETFTLDVITPKAKRLEFKSLHELAKSIENKSRWRTVLANVAGAMATQQTTSVSSTHGTVSASDNVGNSASGVYSGSSTTITVSPDYAARQRANEQARTAVQSAGDMIDYLGRVSLKDNTLMPGQEMSGAVFFERDSKAEGVLLRVPVGNTVFEFPLGRMK